MAANPPSKEFGKRRPRQPADLPLPPREPVKRSGHVALLVMGTIALGTTAFVMMPRRNCDPTPPGATVPGTTVPGATAPAQANTNCAAMSDPKIWSFYGFGAAVFWSYEDCFLQFQAKTLDEYSWASDVATLERLVAYPPYRAVWKMARDGMGGDYRDYVDSLMDKVSSDTSRSLTDVFKIYIAEELPSAEACESA